MPSLPTPIPATNPAPSAAQAASASASPKPIASSSIPAAAGGDDYPDLPASLKRTDGPPAQPERISVEIEQEADALHAAWVPSKAQPDRPPLAHFIAMVRKDHQMKASAAKRTAQTQGKQQAKAAAKPVQPKAPPSQGNSPTTPPATTTKPAAAAPGEATKESDMKRKTAETTKSKARTGIKAKTTKKASSGDRNRYDWNAAQEKAAKGVMPSAPDFSAPTHERFRPLLKEVVEAAKTGKMEALRKIKINPISSSPKAVAKYRDLCVAALKAKAS